MKEGLKIGLLELIIIIVIGIPLILTIRETKASIEKDGIYTTGTVTMRATFQNPKNRLLNGEFVNIKLFANNKTNVPVVPVTAVQENQEGKYVYKIDENGLPQLTYIKVNGQTGKNWIIANGLKPGDKIIVDGILKVMPGLPVKVVTKEEMAKLNKALYSEKKD